MNPEDLLRMLGAPTEEDRLKLYGKFNKRTIDSIIDEVFYSFEHKRNVVGTLADDMPRMKMLFRAQAEDESFNLALATFAAKILELFPNDPDFKDKM